MEITEHTRTRLRRFRGHYPAVCERAGLGYSWLTKFACGERGRRPSYDTMERLTAALDAMEAEAARSRQRRRAPIPRTKDKAHVR